MVNKMSVPLFRFWRLGKLSENLINLGHYNSAFIYFKYMYLQILSIFMLSKECQEKKKRLLTYPVCIMTPHCQRS